MQLPAHPCTFDYSIRELVLDVVSATEALAAEKKLALEVDVPRDLPRGRGDERRLIQVLINLVSNAIKFTEAGSVSIRATVADGSFVVAVSDTGVGIAPQDRERIFEEFRQVDTSSTRRKDGTGLGLAIARRIVELHGGRICVESTPGQGSTFVFTCPLASRARKPRHDRGDPMRRRNVALGLAGLASLSVLGLGPGFADR